MINDEELEEYQEDAIAAWFRMANCAFEWHDNEPSEISDFCPICGMSN